ncbi:Helix-turn-helix domain-containing protein [Actinacidiphila yanglinensis]|uniref:Helix-turn-helix domain-containing protein n=1 Tax=Actinacidiphila yanglinensis TaxID=310779 RepID=A0A1H5ZBI0_9ACTN|nr:helix-turn-helix transcriptional regulator [Actinacidiphila yanglinensis]SEG33748.1 Helix-turn-helix domain-containing protein [Actinacidiphila yanglinensis]
MTAAHASNGSTVRLMVLGRRLRDLRAAAEMSFEDAALVLDVAPMTIRRMEIAKGRWKLPYVRSLLEAYGVPEAEAVPFLDLVREANEPGWWHGYRDALPSWFNAYVSLEQAAALIRGYEPHYVPGLLQTEAYARAVLRTGSNGAGPGLDRRVAVRAERQKLLTAPTPPEIWMVIDETVLRRPVVPPDVMRGQLDRLAELIDLPHVTLQIMPFGTCPHEGMYGPFHIFRLPHEEISDIVYIEYLAGAMYLDQGDEVAVFHEALDRICAQALPVQRTGRLLAAFRRDLTR